MVANLFFDELGEPLPAPLRTIYQWASEARTPRWTIFFIQKDLDEATQFPAHPGRVLLPVRGFKHMYHMVVRSAARSG